MAVDKTMDLAIGGGPGQHRQYADHENGRQAIHLALRPARIGDGGENIQ